MSISKFSKIIGGVLFLIVLVFIQLSFIDSLPRPWSNINLILILLFLLVLLVNYELGFWSAVISGLLLEIFSPYVFGGILLPLALTIATVNFLFKLLFTNRSFFSLMALSFLGLVIYHFLNFFYLAAAFRLNFSSLSIKFDNFYLSNILWEALFVLLGLILIFASLRLFSRRFRSVFLVEGRR